MTMSTVYVVDDDDDLRDALAMLMRSVGLQATAFASGREFLSRLNPRQPGCVVLDIRMNGMSGIEVQQELRRRRYRWPVVFLTGHGDVPLAVKAMKDGAVDFIQKPLDEHRLVLAVMNALRQDVTPDAPPVAALPAANEALLASLSAREREVLEWVIGGKSSQDIADALCISLKTVEFHRARIREKLGVGSLPELFRLVLGR